MLVNPALGVAKEIDRIDPREWVQHNAPRKRRGSPERSAQRSVVSFLRTVLPPGSIVAAVVNEQRGAGRTAEQRARFGAARRASGVVSGFPDLICLLPAGRTVLIEMKAPRTGRLSDAQRELHARIAALGHPVAVATSIDTALAALRAAGVPLRGVTL